jgi:Protein of unknown function (DUF742)
MTDPEQPGPEWLDDDAGPVVRPYAVSGGRTRGSSRFDVLAFVVATQADRPTPPGVGAPQAQHLQPEHRRILDRARTPVSVAELGAHLNLPLGVVRVLLSDLLQERLIAIHEPVDGAKRPEENVLKAVIDGLRAL